MLTLGSFTMHTISGIVIMSHYYAIRFTQQSEQHYAVMVAAAVIRRRLYCWWPGGDTNKRLRRWIGPTPT